MKRRTLWAGIAAVTLAGCATQWDVDRFEAPEASIAAKRTFYWSGGEIAAASPIDRSAEQAADRAIRETVIAGLVRQGYEQLSEQKQADLIIGYQISGTRRFEQPDDRRIGAPSPNQVLSPSEVQPPPASAMSHEQLVRDGSVMVYANDPATGRLIWRGLVTAELRIGSSEEGVRVVNEMARRIVEEFPARTGAPAK